MSKKIRVRKYRKPRSTLVIDAIRRKGGTHKEKQRSKKAKQKEKQDWQKDTP